MVEHILDEKREQVLNGYSTSKSETLLRIGAIKRKQYRITRGTLVSTGN